MKSTFCLLFHPGLLDEAADDKMNLEAMVCSGMKKISWIENRGEYFSLGCDNHQGKFLKFGKFAEKFWWLFQKVHTFFMKTWKNMMKNA